MGLAVSQVRLLALTNRKADIELNMQIDSKRKMMLTRKSTELAQRYYSKLQNANIQYATSAGYEDVNYNYLMGDTDPNNLYNAEFLNNVAFGSSSMVKKAANNMVLTNQFGEVVVNNSLATIIAKTQDNYNAASTAKQTCYAILQLIEEYKNKTVSDADLNGSSAMKFIYQFYGDEAGIDVSKKDKLAQNMTYILQSGGYKGSSIIYADSVDSNVFYTSASDVGNSMAKQIFLSDLEIGRCYEIRDSQNKQLMESTFFGSTSADSTNRGFVKNFNLTAVKYLSNLISYFGPMISAAIQNGTSTQVTRTEHANSAERVGDTSAYKIQGLQKCLTGYDRNTNQTFTVDLNSNQSLDQLTKQIGYVLECANRQGGSAAEAGLKAGQDNYIQLTDSSGATSYWLIAYNSVSQKYSFNRISSTAYYEKYEVTDNATYSTALNTDRLQAGFRSGTFQLAMVTDPKYGTYHKNTTMNYFTHMNYVVERTDSSKREEITAWFNAEQAQISEQETYWDTEIQNLSAELSAVNTEISSVKQLKSDSIKSVFSWGNS